MYLFDLIGWMEGMLFLERCFQEWMLFTRLKLKELKAELPRPRLWLLIVVNYLCKCIRPCWRCYLFHFHSTYITTYLLLACSVMSTVRSVISWRWNFALMIIEKMAFANMKFVERNPSERGSQFIVLSLKNIDTASIYSVDLLPFHSLLCFLGLFCLKTLLDTFSFVTSFAV